ncbi:hypothetical protein ACFL0T_01290 [Candidatus Omnitrophota bacterium]
MENIDLKNLDNKSKIEIAATTIFILIFIIILSRNIKFIKGKPKKSARPVPKITDINSADVSLDGLKSLAKKKPKDYSDEIYSGDDIGWGVDPFYHSGLIDDTSGARLEGIVWDPQRPQAIINGTVVEAGDSIGQNKVLEIREDFVIINDGKESRELRVW